MSPERVLALLAIAAAGVAGVYYLLRQARNLARSLVSMSDAILGTEEHPGLPQRLQRIEHELVTNNGSSLRDVADRLEVLAGESHRATSALQRSITRNAAASRKHRDQDRDEAKAARAQDREQMVRMAARLDAIKAWMDDQEGDAS